MAITLSCTISQEQQCCNLTFVSWFWATKMCLWVSTISQTYVWLPDLASNFLKSKFWKLFYILGQNCWDKIENLFFSQKTPLPSNQCCSQSFQLLAAKLGHIQHYYWRVRRRIWNLKKWVISWIYWIFNFCLNKFYPWLWEIFET